MGRGTLRSMSALKSAATVKIAKDPRIATLCETNGHWPYVVLGQHITCGNCGELWDDRLAEKRCSGKPSR